MNDYSVNAFAVLSTLVWFMRTYFRFPGVASLLPPFPVEWRDIVSLPLYYRIRSDLYQYGGFYKRRYIRFPNNVWRHMVEFKIDYRVLSVNLPTFTDMCSSYNSEIVDCILNVVYLAKFFEKKGCRSFNDITDLLDLPSTHMLPVRMLLLINKVPNWVSIQRILNVGVDFNRLFITGTAKERKLLKLLYRYRRANIGKELEFVISEQYFIYDTIHAFFGEYYENYSV